MLIWSTILYNGLLHPLAWQTRWQKSFCLNITNFNEYMCPCTTFHKAIQRTYKEIHVHVCHLTVRKSELSIEFKYMYTSIHMYMYTVMFDVVHVLLEFMWPIFTCCGWVSAENDLIWVRWLKEPENSSKLNEFWWDVTNIMYPERFYFDPSE